jgi:hypothetical protein
MKNANRFLSIILIAFTSLSAGIYIYQLRAGKFVKNRKMILLK